MDRARRARLAAADTGSPDLPAGAASHSTSIVVPDRQPGGNPPGPEAGWGGRIRTSGCEIQSLVPYRLATPHQQNGISVTVRASSARSG